MYHMVLISTFCRGEEGGGVREGSKELWFHGAGWIPLLLISWSGRVRQKWPSSSRNRPQIQHFCNCGIEVDFFIVNINTFYEQVD